MAVQVERRVGRPAARPQWFADCDRRERCPKCHAGRAMFRLESVISHRYKGGGAREPDERYGLTTDLRCMACGLRRALIGMKYH